MEEATPVLPALRLDQVTKAFGHVVALRHGKLTMHRGSIQALHRSEWIRGLNPPASSRHLAM